MKQRLRQIIDYVAEGKPSVFARAMGWKSQYLNLLLTSKGGVGLKPLTSILAKYPEINARWLLLGEGEMLSSATDAIHALIAQLLNLEENAKSMTRKEVEIISHELSLTTSKLQGFCQILAQKTAHSE